MTMSETNKDLNEYYVTCEVLVAMFAVVGNALVIYVFRKERRLRKRTNYYIVSLAAADLLVGLLGIPFAILSSVGLPGVLYGCLFTVSLLLMLCTISIFCLVAVSVDRYWAILHPMGYSRNVRTKTALVIISICWLAGSVVGFLPMMGWHKSTSTNHSNTTSGNPDQNFSCKFNEVMDGNYLVFLYIGTIILPALILAAFYAHIYQVVLKQLRQIVIMHPEKNSSSEGTMVRMLGVQQTNEVKATQNLAFIVLFFMICWIPLYTINCIETFADVTPGQPYIDCCVILSHINSAGNPLLYAYHLRDFRVALKKFFCTLFDKRRYCEQLNNTNYHSHDFPKIKSSATPPRQLSKFRTDNMLTPRITTVTNASPVAPTNVGGRTRSIENSVTSSASLKSLESCDPGYNLVQFYPDKILKNRPPTPYRPRNLTEINPAYLIPSYLEGSDDGFNEEETLPYHDYDLDDCELETCLSYKMRTAKIIPPSCNLSLSTSSPQLSRGLFLVEAHRGNNKTVSFSLHDPKRPVGLCLSDDCTRKSSSFNLSPFRVVNIFRNKKELNRSMSEGGNLSKKSCSNGILSEPYSFQNNKLAHVNK